MRDLFLTRSKIEIERWRRIRVALWAYAYEIKNTCLVSDHVFDRECLKVDLSISTGRPDLDCWFAKEFQPHTGSWIRKHPELNKLERIYNVLQSKAV